MSDDLWRNLVNSLDDFELTDGFSPPQSETFTQIRPPAKIFVQKIITEIYVFSDSDNKLFGEKAFQDVQVLGEMTTDKFIKILEREKKKRQGS